jgi:hypothetical protein
MENHTGPEQELILIGLPRIANAGLPPAVMLRVHVVRNYVPQHIHGYMFFIAAPVVPGQIYEIAPPPQHAGPQGPPLQGPTLQRPPPAPEDGSPLPEVTPKVLLGGAGVVSGSKWD